MGRKSFYEKNKNKVFKKFYNNETKQITETKILIKKKYMCISDGCFTTGNYRKTPISFERYCCRHKNSLPNSFEYKDWKNKLNECEKSNCSKRSSFNYKNMKPRFCGQHKDDEMVNVVHGCCEEDLCSFKPHFSFKNEKHPRFCSKHALTGMIDIIHPKCIICDEYKSKPVRAKYNYPNDKGAKYCNEHCKKGMVIKHIDRRYQPKEQESEESDEAKEQ